MTLVKIQKQIWIFYFDFCQNFDVRTFSQWLSIKKIFFCQMFTLVLWNGILDGSLKFLLLILENCFLISDFEVLFKNYIMHWLSMRGNNFIACWAYEETISSHTESTPIFAHAQPMSNQFSRMLSVRGNHNPF